MTGSSPTPRYTAALITNIPITSWGNEMIFTEKIEKELI
jgi:hypothetical protein